MLTHYIIVRRDLSLGVLAAMVTHAAGESAVFYQDPENGRFRDARAVVLEVKGEWDLIKTERLLQDNNIQYISVVDAGKFMAIGLVPVESDKVSAVLRPFQTLKEVACKNCEIAPESTIRSEIKNDDELVGT